MTRILGIGNIAKLPKMVESFKFCEKKWIGSLFSSVKQMKNYHYKNHLFICKSTQIKSNVITICEALWSNMNNELMVRYAIRCTFELEIIILRINACDVGNKICTDFMISRYIRYIFPRNDALQCIYFWSNMNKEFRSDMQ